MELWLSFVVLLLGRENLRGKVNYVAGIAPLHIKEARADSNSNSVSSGNVGQVMERYDLSLGQEISSSGVHVYDTFNMHLTLAHADIRE